MKLILTFMKMFSNVVLVPIPYVFQIWRLIPPWNNGRHLAWSLISVGRITLNQQERLRVRF